MFGVLYELFMIFKSFCAISISLLAEVNVKEEKKGQDTVAIWRENVETASTLSRLHVLLGMLDSCIKWEKSAENAVRNYYFVF